MGYRLELLKAFECAVRDRRRHRAFPNAACGMLVKETKILRCLSGYGRGRDMVTDGIPVQEWRFMNF